eukprot:gene47723-10820_t
MRTHRVLQLPLSLHQSLLGILPACAPARPPRRGAFRRDDIALRQKYKNKFGVEWKGETDGCRTWSVGSWERAQEGPPYNATSTCDAQRRGWCAWRWAPTCGPLSHPSPLHGQLPPHPYIVGRVARWCAALRGRRIAMLGDSLTAEIFRSLFAEQPARGGTRELCPVPCEHPLPLMCPRWRCREFPVVNPAYVGRRSRWAWASRLMQGVAEPLPSDGVVKVDLDTGAVPQFVPRRGGELRVLDAATMMPIAAVTAP